MPAILPLPRIFSVLTLVLPITLSLASHTFAQQQEDDCDYSDAAANFGWGWNPATDTSCPPTDPEQIIELFLPAADGDAPETEAPEAEELFREALIDELRLQYCDYTDAPLNAGWGWNNVLLESCPPVTANHAAPVVVSDIALPSIDYPLHLHVSTDSTLYLFHPAKNTLAARHLDGSVIWDVPLQNSTFITDLKLTPNQDLLIASSLGGRLLAFHTDGSLAWQIDQPGVSNSGPDIQPGETAVVAYYVPEDNTGMEPFIVSYDFSGTERWRYEGNADQQQKVEGFTLGADGLVYIRIDAPELEGKRYVVVQQ
jgi:hypothetical protein